MGKRGRKGAGGSEPHRLHTIKVTLNRIRPPIWRRVVIRSDATLGDLHRLVQEAFGWTDSHLHRLEVGGTQYSGKSEFGGADIEEMGCEDEGSVTVGRALGLVGTKFTYEYDFGDGWTHTGVVEKVEPAPPGARPVACIGGKRRCPPEDCGGPWGYARLVELVANPTLPDPDGLREWIGEGFDSENFDAAEVDRALARVKG